MKPIRWLRRVFGRAAKRGDDLRQLRELCSRAADLAAEFPDEAIPAEEVAAFMTQRWNLDITRAAGWMARTIIHMCDQRMKESQLVERALMELVANQAVLNEAPDNALRFSMEEHNSNWRISQAMERYSIGSPEERAAKAEELEAAAAVLRSHDLDPTVLNRSDFKPFGRTVKARFEAAGLVPYYEVLYLVASDYAHMNGRAVHNYLERDFGETAAMGALAITTDFLIRSLRMANEKLDADLEGEIDALQAEYVAAQPAGADRGESS